MLAGELSLVDITRLQECSYKGTAVLCTTTAVLLLCRFALNPDLCLYLSQRGGIAYVWAEEPIAASPRLCTIMGSLAVPQRLQHTMWMHLLLPTVPWGLHKFEGSIIFHRAALQISVQSGVYSKVTFIPELLGHFATPVPVVFLSVCRVWPLVLLWAGVTFGIKTLNLQLHVDCDFGSLLTLSSYRGLTQCMVIKSVNWCTKITHILSTVMITVALCSVICCWIHILMLFNLKAVLCQKNQWQNTPYFILDLHLGLVDLSF